MVNKEDDGVDLDVISLQRVWISFSRCYKLELNQVGEEMGEAVKVGTV